ncbi:MAG TPA: chemotaxis protein CheB [Nitriliruptorales bacterium]|nr:chemotaxis protein CheB [Nitriliruptorales bacterium]
MSRPVSGGRVRVVVARPTPVARARLAEALAGDPHLAVVGTAATGHEAVRITARLRPSIVLLDAGIGDPGVVETTRAIMIDHPTPVVVVADAADRLEAAFAALTAGAVSVQREPPGGASGAEARFAAVVRALADVALVRRRARPSAPPSATRRGRARVAAVAGSTGGPAALQRLLIGLPQGFDLPMLVVQHLPPGHTAQFVEWLGRSTRRCVRLAEDGQPLTLGHVHVAPDEAHLAVTPEGLLRIERSEPVDGFRPSATVLFASVARAYGRDAVGLVLSGMGSDGVAGLAELRDAGGWILVQDQATSVVFGMPGAAVAAGVAHETVPLDRLAERLAAVGASTASRS